LVSREDDPNSLQISAYVQKDLAIQFKQLLTAKGLNIGEGLEEALALYLEAQTSKADSTRSVRSRENRNTGSHHSDKQQEGEPATDFTNAPAPKQSTTVQKLYFR